MVVAEAVPVKPRPPDGVVPPPGKGAQIEIVTAVTGACENAVSLEILAQCAIAAGFGSLPLPKRGPVNLSLTGPELRDNNEPCG